MYKVRRLILHNVKTSDDWVEHTIRKSSASFLLTDEEFEFLYNLPKEYKYVEFDNEFYKFLKSSLKEQVYYDNNLYYLLFNEKQNNVLNNVKINKEVVKNHFYTVIEYPVNLVRLDDLVGVSRYILDNAKTNYTAFTNELYATYISVNTIESMVTRAI